RARAHMLVRPGLFESSDGRGRKPAGILAEQGDQCFLEVAGGDAFEIEDRDQHLEALRAARVGRQDRRGKADAIGAFADTVAHPWAAHRDRTDAGHDFALGQMPVTHQALAAVIGEFVDVAAEQGGYFGLDRLRQQRSRPLRSTSVSGSANVPGWESWKTLVSVTAYHSLGGEVEASKHPHDTPPQSLMPSPTFANSSRAEGAGVKQVRSLSTADGPYRPTSSP